MRVSIKIRWGLLVALAMMLASGPTFGNDKFFKKKIIGTYGFTTEQTCARSTAAAPGTVSIDPVTRQFNTEVHIVDMAGSGEMIFSRDGNFILDGFTAAELDKHDLTAGVMPVNDGFYPYCEGAYVMTSKTTFDLEFNCDIDVPAQGITIKAGPVLAEGYMSKGGTAITMNLLQNVQTLTAFVNGNPVGERQRICLQRFSLVKSRK